MKNIDLRGHDKDEVRTDRRYIMKALGGALVLFGCGTGSEDVTGAGGTPGSGAGGTGSGGTGGGGTGAGGTGGSTACAVAPDETIGPYPDKIGMLTNSAYNRSDITEGKPGLALNVVLTVVDTTKACAAITGSQVIIWQCDADGHYSEYGNQPGGFDGTGLTYMRGVQTTDSNGQVTFKTVYPGWYQGRATHIHIEVYVNGVSRKVTQLAFPENVTAAVYASGVYAAKGPNPQANANDMVFADSLQSELANLTGDVASGYTATLTIGVPL